MNSEELEEYYELVKYIESCQGGDRPMSPSAVKLKRYLELRNNLIEKKMIK